MKELVSSAMVSELPVAANAIAREPIKGYCPCALRTEMINLIQNDEV
jgi:hypothetical protein